MSGDPWKAQLEVLGALLRAQRRAADLSLRELSERTNVSNAYLSQLERGLHEPSLGVLTAIASALGVPLGSLLTRAGMLDRDDDDDDDERAGDRSGDPARSGAERAAADRVAERVSELRAGEAPSLIALSNATLDIVRE